ncbi:MAG: hypothetical protein KA059_08845 [Elusimicrobiales bacterium]|nr:hypothetical protein [Elusimicrobiales bacterium]
MKRITSVIIISMLLTVSVLWIKNRYEKDKNITYRFLELNYYINNIWNGYNFLFTRPFMFRNAVTNECVLFSSSNDDFRDIILYDRVISVKNGYVYRGKCSNNIKQSGEYETIYHNGKYVISYLYSDESAFINDGFAIIVHENFHYYQHHKFKDHDKKKFGYKFADIYTPQNIAIKQIEDILLYKAVSEKSDFRKYLAEFIVLRKYRYSKVKKDVKEFENIFERIEGTAKYVENKTYDYESKLKSDLLFPSEIITIENFNPINAMRETAYYSGSSECILIQRIGIKEWQRRVENGEYLFDILSSQVSLSSDTYSAEKILEIYDYKNMVKAADNKVKLRTFYLSDVYNYIALHKYKLALTVNFNDFGINNGQFTMIGGGLFDALIYRDNYALTFISNYLFDNEDIKINLQDIPAFEIFDVKKVNIITGIDSLPVKSGDWFVIREKNVYLKTRKMPLIKGDKVIIEL